jgi:hypothetical protein
VLIDPHIQAQMRAEIRGGGRRQRLIDAILMAFIIELAAYAVYRGSAPVCAWLGW